MSKIVCAYIIDCEAVTISYRKFATEALTRFCENSDLKIFSTWYGTKRDGRNLESALKVIRAGLAQSLLVIGELTNPPLDVDVITVCTRDGFRGGWLPLGWALNAGRIVPDKEETKTVDIMKKGRKKGKTLKAIAEELNGLGIPTKTGSVWDHNKVYQVLKTHQRITTVLGGVK